MQVQLIKIKICILRLFLVLTGFKPQIFRLLRTGLNYAIRAKLTKSSYRMKSRFKVASKSLKRKERNCAFENLSLHCSATKLTLRSSAQRAHLCQQYLLRGRNGGRGSWKQNGGEAIERQLHIFKLDAEIQSEEVLFATTPEDP